MSAAAYLIKGFAEFEALINDVPGQVNDFGQLSDYALSFSRTRTTYANETSDPGIRFTSFYAVDSNNNNVTVPADAATHVLAVSNWFFGRFQAATIASEAAPFPNLINQFVSQFSTGNISILSASVSINALVADTANNTQRLPDYIQWTATDSANSNAQYTFKIWFGDPSFRTQYDQFQIVVVPPFTPVDSFNDTQANVGIRLVNITVASTVAAINTAMANEPPTLIATQNYPWIEPAVKGGNGVVSSPTTWSFVIYGPAGNTAANMAIAIQNYLANPANSALSTTQWQEMFPSVFQSVSYYLIPQWNQIISSNPSVLYSPMVNFGTALADAKASVPFITPNDTFWDQYLRGTTSIYQGVFLWIIGAPTNTGNDFDFRVKFPDYMNIALTDTDAQRMAPITQGFVVFMETLLLAADTVTAATPAGQLPAGISKTTLGGKLFVQGAYNGIQYLAISKGSYTGT